MITGTIKTQVDAIQNAFWTGGISNPLEGIEQMTSLLLIKRLDELHTAREKKAAMLRQPIENAVFGPGQQQLRWSKFRPLGDAPTLHRVVADEVFPFIKNLGGSDDSTYANHMKDARFTIDKPALLAKVVDMLDARSDNLDSLCAHFDCTIEKLVEFVPESITSSEVGNAKGADA